MGEGLYLSHGPRAGRRSRLAGLLGRLTAVWGLLLASGAAVAEVAAPASSPTPATEVRYVVIGAVLDEAALGRLQNAALALRAAADGGREPILLLEVRNGDGPAANALATAEFLTSADLRGVRTVAWLPETVTGPRGLLALACREIVMHPDAEFGELSRGAGLTAADRRQIDRVLAKRTNERVSPAVVAALLDPRATALRVTIAGQQGEPEVRIVTPEELPLLKQAGVAVSDVHPLKSGSDGRLVSGAEAEEGGFLVTHTARDLVGVAKLYRIDPTSLNGAREHGSAQRPVLIKVDGEIQPLLTSYLQRQIERAVAQRADLVIFEIDSPGGLLQDSLELAFAIADLEDHGIRTVAYIPHDAVSGAALISLGCDEIYLHPNGKIGDAGPVVLTQGGNVHRAPEKIVSYLRVYARELAERKGRPPAVVMAMVDRNLAVYAATQRDTGRESFLSADEIEASHGEWKRGAMVPESAPELLLFVNGRRAHELKIAEPPVQNLAELRERLGIPAHVELVAARQTWLDDTVFILNTDFVTGMLFFLGVILLFVELHFMVGIFGIGAALCFGVFFWSKLLGGTAGWLEVLLFLVGFACLALEIFVIPGFGVFGVAGGLLVLGSLVMANITLNELDSGASLDQTIHAARSLGLAIFGVVVSATALSHFLPRIPLLNSIILSPPAAPRSPTVSRTGSSRPDERGLAGQQGTAVTMLRPSGKVRVAGMLLDAVSTSGFVEAGSPVEVVSATSQRVMVRLAAGVNGDGSLPDASGSEGDSLAARPTRVPGNGTPPEHV